MLFVWWLVNSYTCLIVPSVILNTEHRIRELKALCFQGPRGSILSVDKTFSLGVLYVTVVMYKNLAVVRLKFQPAE